MYKPAILVCVLLLAGAATAYPRTPLGRRASEVVPDRDVEEVEPVPHGGSRVDAAAADDASDESSEGIPITIGIGLRGLGGYGGLGGLGGFGGVRPVIVRPFAGIIPRGSAVDDSDEDSDGPLPLPGGYGHPYLSDPMNGFMAQFAEMIAAMRRQMTQVLQHGSPSEEPDFSKLGNTTSTTKVIDGHVVTVNETTIGGKDDSSELHIRVIDIHPSESPESAEGGAGAAVTPSGKDADEDADKDASKDADKDADKDASKDADEDADKDVEPLASSNEVTSRKPKPTRSENEIPMKVGSEVDDLNA